MMHAYIMWFLLYLLYMVLLSSSDKVSRACWRSSGSCRDCTCHKLICSGQKVISVINASYGYKRDCPDGITTTDCSDNKVRCCTQSKDMSAPDCFKTFQPEIMLNLTNNCSFKNLCKLPGFKNEREPCQNRRTNSYSKIEYRCIHKVETTTTPSTVTSPAARTTPLVTTTPVRTTSPDTKTPAFAISTVYSSWYHTVQPTPTILSTSTFSMATSNDQGVGGIVGGVIAGLLLVTIIFVIIFLLIRRSRSRQNTESPGICLGKNKLCAPGDKAKVLKLDCNDNGQGKPGGNYEKVGTGDTCGKSQTTSGNYSQKGNDNFIQTPRARQDNYNHIGLTANICSEDNYQHLADVKSPTRSVQDDTYNHVTSFKTLDEDDYNHLGDFNQSTIHTDTEYSHVGIGHRDGLDDDGYHHFGGNKPDIKDETLDEDYNHLGDFNQSTIDTDTEYSHVGIGHRDGLDDIGFGDNKPEILDDDDYHHLGDCKKP